MFQLAIAFFLFFALCFSLRLELLLGASFCLGVHELIVVGCKAHQRLNCSAHCERECGQLCTAEQKLAMSAFGKKAPQGAASVCKALTRNKNHGFRGLLCCSSTGCIIEHKKKTEPHVEGRGKSDSLTGSTSSRSSTFARRRSKRSTNKSMRRK